MPSARRKIQGLDWLGSVHVLRGGQIWNRHWGHGSIRLRSVRVRDLPERDVIDGVHGLLVVLGGGEVGHDRYKLDGIDRMRLQEGRHGECCWISSRYSVQKADIQRVRRQARHREYILQSNANELS